MAEFTKSRVSIVASAALLAAAPIPAIAQEQLFRFDLPAQSLEASLRAFARTTRQQILFDAPLVRGKRAPALKGNHGAGDALSILLRGSGLVATRTNGGAFVLRDVGNGGSTDIAEAVSEGGDDIVVTGSRIAGAPPTAPVVALSADEIRASGYNNLGEAFRALPQNFSGGQNPEVSAGATAGAFANNNVTGGSGLNLRGLGPDATLTLVNGVRLPFDGLYQATDVSTIPTAAIDRVEILLDGASAIYGSDAVGGVANIVLKRDYEGAELSARYTVPTRGGGDEQQYSAVGGHAWSDGSMLLAVDYARRTDIEARQRGRLAYLPLQKQSLLPAYEQISLLTNAWQSFGGVELGVTGQYAFRVNKRNYLAAATIYTDHRSESEIWSITPVIGFDLFGSWKGRLQGSIGRNDNERQEELRYVANEAFFSRRPFAYDNRSKAAELSFNGPLFSLPGGSARAALGGGLRRNNLKAIDLLTGVTAIDATSRNYYAFGEILLPVISSVQAIPAINKLTLHGAIRYENYNGFGDVVVPKVGAVWSPVRDLDLRISWGKSFKAPALRDQFADENLILYEASRFSGLPSNGTVLVQTGGNTSLRAEKADVLTAGVTFTPGFIDGLQLEAGWFRIDYRGRIVTPVTSLFTAFSNPAFAEFLSANPSGAYQQMLLGETDLFINAAGIPYDPAQVVALVDNRATNAARQLMKGVDLTARYKMPLFGGNLGLVAGASWLDGSRALTSLASEQPVTGVRFFPANFRAKFGATWNGGGLTLAAHLNHTAGVENADINPPVQGGSMTTMDVFGEYFFPAGPLQNVGLSIYVNNLFDVDAPYLQPSQSFYVDYDSTNYSVVGRTVNVKLTKRF